MFLLNGSFHRIPLCWYLRWAELGSGDSSVIDLGLGVTTWANILVRAFPSLSFSELDRGTGTGDHRCHWNRCRKRSQQAYASYWVINAVALCKFDIIWYIYIYIHVVWSNILQMSLAAWWYKNRLIWYDLTRQLHSTTVWKLLYIYIYLVFFFIPLVQ